MPNFVIDYTQITLEENIPLSKDDLNYLEIVRKAYKVLPVVLAFATLFTMGLVCWFIKDSFKTFTYSDYLLLTGAGFSLYFFCYSLGWLLMKFDLNNQRKDIRFGKCKLISVIINREKNRKGGGTYLTFAGLSKTNKIRIQVKEADYNQYRVNTKVVVEYLKYSKAALLIVRL